MKNRTMLNPELEQKILASIRGGGYPHVAAAAWGVPDSLWEKWQRWGTGKGARRPYRDFFREVAQAAGQARLRAELAALEADPRSWLKHGPGKEQPANPGWTVMTKPVPPRRQTLDLFSSPEVLQLLARVRGVLALHPEVLAAFSKTLEDTPVRLPTSSVHAEPESEESTHD